MDSPGSSCGKRAHLRTVFFWDVCVCVRSDQRGHPNHSLFEEERKGFGQLVQSLQRGIELWFIFFFPRLWSNFLSHFIYFI